MSQTASCQVYCWNVKSGQHLQILYIMYTLLTVFNIGRTNRSRYNPLDYQFNYECFPSLKSHLSLFSRHFSVRFLSFFFTFIDSFSFSVIIIFACNFSDHIFPISNVRSFSSSGKVLNLKLPIKSKNTFFSPVS